MDDYIKREDVLSDIAELKKSPWYAQTYGHADRVEAIDIVTKLCVKAQPAADVVEVVRCKECTHHIKDEHTGIWWCIINGGICNDDFYCADGKRRETI